MKKKLKKAILLPQKTLEDEVIGMLTKDEKDYIKLQ